MFKRNKLKKNRNIQQSDKMIAIVPYRKKQIRRKRMKQFFWTIAVLLGIFVIALIASTLQKLSLRGTKQAEFPISLRGETPLDLDITDQSLVITTAGAVKSYAFTAEKQNEWVHGFSNPVTITAGQYSLTYDQGGYGIQRDRVGTASKTLKVENQILFCRIDSDGKVAVVTRNSKYPSEISIYDQQLSEPIFVHYMNERVMSLDFSGSESCIVAAQGVNGGAFETILYGLKFYRDQPTFETRFPTSMIVSVSSKAEGRIALVCTEEFVLLDEKGANLKRYSYDTKLSYVDNSWEAGTLIALENIENPNQNDVLLFSKSEQPDAQTRIYGTIRDMKVFDRRILILDQTNLTEFNLALKELKQYAHIGAYNRLAKTKNGIFALGKEKLQKIES